LRFRYGGPGEIERLSREAVEDAALDGVVHLELRFSPVFLARRFHEQPDGDPFTAAPPPFEEIEAVAEAIVRGARAEAQRRNVSVAFILTLNRAGGTALNRPATGLLRRPMGEAIAAVDVAGDESLPLDELKPLLAEWREAGKVLTLHAGEDPRGDGAARVREAVLVYGATRIGHGIRAIEDASTVSLLRERGIVLETCLTSNIQTGAAASYEAHPLKRLLAAGVRATLNSDDPTISGIRLSDDCDRAVTRAGLSKGDLRQATVNAAAGAFMTDAQRARLLGRLGV
jgi:adenosine deaminase